MKPEEEDTQLKWQKNDFSYNIHLGKNN